MKRTLVTFLFLSLVACAPVEQEREETPPPPAIEEPTPTPEPEVPPPAQARRVDITADNWSFTPAAITAKQGEALEVRLTGIGGVHGFNAPGLGINTPISAGETVTVTIPTTTAGTYEFFCSIPCGSGHRDMRGTIVIQP